MNSDINISRDNNFDLLRVLAALCVLVSHSFAIVTGDPDTEPLNDFLGVSLGSLSVDFFFVSSGFLVCASYMHRRSPLSFVKARALRIFPGLIVMLVLTLIFVGSVISRQPILSFFTDIQTWTYLAKNTFLFFGVEYALPGAFEELPYANVINGSLWTLPHELRAYLALLLICWFTIHFLSFNYLRFILLLTSLLALGFELLTEFIQIRLPYHQFFHLFGLFSAGATLLLWDVHKNKHLHSITIVSGLGLLICVYFDVFKFLHAFIVPIFVIGVAYYPSRILRYYNRFGDYSYGIYIYAFPIQQSLIYFFNEISITSMVLVTLLLSYLFALPSWHFIEKPFLKLK